MNTEQTDIVQAYIELEKNVNDNFVNIASVLRRYQEHIELLHRNMDALKAELESIRKPKLIVPDNVIAGR